MAVYDYYYTSRVVMSRTYLFTSKNTPSA